MSDFLHTMARVMNQPLLVTPHYLSTVLELISERRVEANHAAFILPELAMPIGQSYNSLTEEPSRKKPQGIAMIDVFGSTAHKPGSLRGGMSSTMRTYQQIVSEAQAAMDDPGVKGLMFHFKSPGGEATGNFAAVRELASMRGQKPMWGVVDELIASAAMNIGGALDRLVGPPELQAGSIGAVAAHVSQEGALDKAGLKVTFIHSGKYKIEGNAAQDLSDETMARMQSKLDSMSHDFATMFAENRKLDVRDVKELEADVLQGSDALKAGLVDELMSTSEAFDAFVEHVNGASQTTIAGISMSGSEGVETDAKAVEAAKNETEQVKADAALEVKRVKDIYALESANQSDVHRKMAAEFVDAGMSVEQSDKMLKLVPVPAELSTTAEGSEPEGTTDMLGKIEDGNKDPANEVNADLSDDKDGKKADRTQLMVNNFTSNTAGFFNKSLAKAEAAKGAA